MQILTIMNKNMPVALGWALAIIVIGGFAAATFYSIRSRKRAGLPTPAMSVWAAKVDRRSRSPCSWWCSCSTRSASART